MQTIAAQNNRITSSASNDDYCDTRPTRSSSCGHCDPHTALNAPLIAIGGMLVLNSFLARHVVFVSEPIASATSALAGAALLSIPILITAAKHMMQGRFFMNELVAVALLAAFVLGRYQEVGVIAFFMLIAIAIEEKTAIGATASIEELIKLTPTTASRFDEQSGKEEKIPVQSLQVGDIIRVRPGENFPVDGVVSDGSSTVNQASISGESLPVDKERDSNVYAGTENLTGVMNIRVTKVGSDTTMGKVRELIEAAEKSRSPVIRLVENYLVYYTPAIIMIAGVVWFFNQDLMQIVLLLVIACPCALIVATPSAVIAAIATAARQGVLIKNVADIESAATINAIVFDKTGTLTKGELEVAHLAPVSDIELNELLRTAAVAESASNHPVAIATTKLAKEAKLALETVYNVQEVPGKGVIARFDSTVIMVGRDTWFDEQKIDISESLNSVRQTATADTMSIIHVVKNGTALGWIGFRDAIRPDAKASIKRLRELGIAACGMVTGDKRAVAETVAKEVGIDDVQWDCLPERKVEFVERLKTKGQNVGVIGDGVNDAPALAAGDISVAMGAIGSDVAINSASIALMNNSLFKIPFLIELSRKTRTTININLLVGTCDYRVRYCRFRLRCTDFRFFGDNPIDPT